MSLKTKTKRMRNKGQKVTVEKEKLVVMYCRVSSREQAEGYSTDAQLRLNRELIAREGLTQAHEPWVEVHSAKSKGRPAFENMVGYLRKHPEIGGIVAHKMDRLGRNLGDLAILFEELHLRPWLVEQNFPNNAQGQLAYNMLGVFAKYYSDNLREEVKKGHAQKAREGGTPFHAPHGYLHLGETGDVPALDPKRRDGLKRIFEEAATGKYTYDELRERAFKAGYRYGDTQVRIPRSTLERIVKNPYYAGEIHFAGEVFPALHEPLVSRELFARVQVALQRSPNGYGKHEQPFKGLLRCSCGRSVTPEEKVKLVGGVEPRSYFYYRCARYRACGGERLSLAELEKALAEVVAKVRLPDDHLAILRGALAVTKHEEREFRERAIRELESQARSAREKRDAALMEKLDGRINDEEFQRVRDRLREVESSALIALESHRRAGEASVDLAEKVLGLCNRAPELWMRQDYLGKEKLLKILCSDCVLVGGRLQPEWRSPFRLVAEGLSIPVGSETRD